MQLPTPVPLFAAAGGGHDVVLHLAGVDYLILGLYFVFVLAIGWILRKYLKTSTQARAEAAEFRELVGAGRLSWDDVQELGDLVTGKVPGRRSQSAVTLFKSLGIGLEDVAFAERCTGARAKPARGERCSRPGRHRLGQD